MSMEAAPNESNEEESLETQKDSLLDLPAPCLHLILTIETKINHCKTFLCIFCIIIGVIFALIALVIALKNCISKDNSYLSQSQHSLLDPGDHWLYELGFEPDFIIQRFSSSKGSLKKVKSCLCGINYPFKYKIKCLECKTIIKEGKQSDGLLIGTIIGILGIFAVAVSLICLM
jgi:hypothetical protein